MQCYDETESEPWYQSQGPDINEIIGIFTTSFGNNYKNIITKIVEDYYKSKGGPGSYRGYYTFDHTTLQNIIKRELRMPILRHKLYIYMKGVGYLSLYWREYIHRRYAPGGAGYHKAEKHYNKQKQ